MAGRLCASVQRHCLSFGCAMGLGNARSEHLPSACGGKDGSSWPRRSSMRRSPRQKWGRRNWQYQAGQWFQGDGSSRCPRVAVGCGRGRRLAARGDVGRANHRQPVSGKRSAASDWQLGIRQRSARSATDPERGIELIAPHRHDSLFSFNVGYDKKRISGG